MDLAGDARLVHQNHRAKIISMTKWIRTSRLSIMNSLSWQATMAKFYDAFKRADPAHALIQCVDIMSDDQSALLKKVLPFHPEP